MAEAIYRVELTASFLERLNSIEAFWIKAGMPEAFSALLIDLRATIVPSLARFPRSGRRYLDNPPQSVEGLRLLATLPMGSPGTWLEYVHDEYSALYVCTEAAATVALLSIRHQRELADPLRTWSATTKATPIHGPAS